MGDEPRGKAAPAPKDANKLFKCGPLGPGPAYKLPPVIGYPGHDITKWRYPAYSIAQRVSQKSKGLQSPLYDPGRVNRFGKFYSPAFSLLKRIPQITKHIGPGPAAYNTQNMKDFSKRTPPAATIKSRPKMVDHGIGPGPGAYYLKPPSVRAIKMKFRHPAIDHSIGPGPGAYGAPNMDKFGRRAQYAKIMSRPQVPKKDFGPGPAYFPQFNLGRKVPAFTFGVKYSDCVGTYSEKEEIDPVCGNELGVSLKVP